MKISSRLWMSAIACAFTFAICWVAASAQKSSSSQDNAGCLQNVKQVALATLMYCQDYDERFPPMKSYSKFQKVVLPYIKKTSVFTCPVTGKPYKLNATLNQSAIAKVKAPAGTPLVYDASPHSDGMWTVAYADGHAKREKKAPVIK